MYEQLFVSFVKITQGNNKLRNSKFFGNSLFLTEVVAFSVSMLIQDKSMSLPLVNSPRIKKKSDVIKTGVKCYRQVLPNSVIFVSHHIAMKGLF